MITFYLHLGPKQQYKARLLQGTHTRRYQGTDSNLYFNDLTQSTICYTSTCLDRHSSYDTSWSSGANDLYRLPHYICGKSFDDSPVYLSQMLLTSCHRSLRHVGLIFCECQLYRQHRANALGNSSFICGILPFHTCSSTVQGKGILSKHTQKFLF